jgi:hypothetical protein
MGNDRCKVELEESAPRLLFNPLAPTPPEADLRSWGIEEEKT